MNASVIDPKAAVLTDSFAHLKGRILQMSSEGKNTEDFLRALKITPSVDFGGFGIKTAVATPIAREVPFLSLISK